MKPAPFTYHRARDVHDAVGLLRDLTDADQDPKLIAGGQSLMPMMAFRLARPGALVDLGHLSRSGALQSIEVDASGELRIGALTTHHQVECSATLGPAGFGVLARAMGWVGHLPIRTRGTVGGSLAHGDSTAEWCLLALLLEARIVVEGPGGRREVPAADMFQGFYATAVEPDEVVTEVVFPRPAPHAALTEFAQRRGDFAIVDAAVDLRVVDGELVGGRVVLGGVDPAPIRVESAEAALAAGGDPTAVFEAAARIAAEAVDPPSDAHGSAGYRRELTRSLVVRACRQAWHAPHPQRAA